MRGSGWDERIVELYDKGLKQVQIAYRVQPHFIEHGNGDQEY